MSNVNCDNESKTSDQKPFYVIQKDDILGRGWRANQNLEAGLILLDESPVICSPPWTSRDFNSVPNCLTCGLYMELNARNSCSNCHWPVCSVECSENKIHSLNECHVFSTKKIKYPPSLPMTPSELCDCLLLIRGFNLQNLNTINFNDVMTLQDHFDDQFNPIIHQLAHLAVKKLENLIGPISDDAQFKIYEKIARIRKVNAFGHDSMNLNEGESSSLIYLKSSRLNHCCRPNCTWSLTSDNQIRIRTSIPIDLGHRLTISYSAGESQLGTYGRQLALRHGFGFICACDRCTDPTELESYVSAVTCQNCRIQRKIDESKNIGYLLPQNPLNLEPNSLWECNQCRGTKKLSQMLQFILMGREIQNYGNNLKLYQNFVDKYKDKILHRNHWIVQRAAEGILNCQMNFKDTMTRREIQNCVELYKYLLNIQDKTTPGICVQRGFTLKNLSSLLLTFLAHYGMSMTSKEMEEWALYCRKCQLEALKYFEFENEMAPNSIADKLLKEISILDENIDPSLFK